MHNFDNGQLQTDDFLIYQISSLSKIDVASILFEAPGAVKGKILNGSEM